MTKFLRLSTAKVGMAPGAVVFTGRKKLDQVQVKKIRYGVGIELEEVEVADVSTLRPGAEPGVTWINMYGLHDTAAVQTLCKSFGIHPLAIEDIVVVGGRPQVMEYEGFLFASLKMLSQDEEGAIESEHVTLLTGPGWVLSFQERVGDVFEPLRERMRQSSTRVRERGADYLWYALMDAVVDRYLHALDALTERVDGLETEVWENTPSADMPARVQQLRDEVNGVRRAVRPLREEIDSLVRDAYELIDRQTRPFFRDLQDHLHQLGDAIEGMRETLTSIREAHLALVSMRMNEIMKVLTIMASLFIPLTFIAGIYGMNFEYMPELGVRWGYFAVWGVMIAASVGMLAYFKVKKWI